MGYRLLENVTYLNNFPNIHVIDSQPLLLQYAIFHRALQDTVELVKARNTRVVS